QNFVQSYGMVVLAAPPTSGFSRVAWIMPFVSLIGGVVVVALVIRMWKSKTTPAPVRAVAGAAQMDSFRKRAREETEL
ncbi:MAG TPA: cytochrome c-type biogenesis protein CcmH, partial [Terriglobales bacterium]|nr:cytochrome c-type biogenesis protein CcmH [Terriglobales bacterium]